MLTYFKTAYLKSRVIPVSYSLEKIMVDYVKAGFEDPEDRFSHIDASKFYEAKFLSYIAPRWKADQTLFTPNEWQKYQDSLDSIKQFTDLKEFLENQRDFFWELKGLYLEITREQATANSWNRRNYTTKTWEEDAHEALVKYNNLINELEDNPEWQKRVKDESGYYAHMIFTSLTQKEGTFSTVFDKFVRKLKEF